MCSECASNNNNPISVYKSDFCSADRRHLWKAKRDTLENEGQQNMPPMTKTQLNKNMSTTNPICICKYKRQKLRLPQKSEDKERNWQMQAQNQRLRKNVGQSSDRTPNDEIVINFVYLYD